MALFDELFSAQANFFGYLLVLAFAINYFTGTSHLDIGILAVPILNLILIGLAV